MRTRALALLVLCGLWSCSGGGGTQGAAAIAPTAGTTPVSPTGPTIAASARFTITVPAQNATTSSSSRTPKYVSPATQSIIITLVSVGGVPYTGNPASIATNLSTLNPACTGTTSLTCTVTAAAVVGSDVFSVVTYDTAQTLPFTTPTGNVLSRASLSVAVVAGPNVVTTPLVLNGIPASFAIAPPAGTAGTAFSPQVVTIAVKDADGNTIVGPYQNPVTLSDGDTSGATTLATSGSDSPSAGQLLSSSDAATLSYTGLAIAPATISATATGATTGNGSFTPALQPISPTTLPGGVYVNAFGASAPVTFTPSETGWTNAPYNKAMTATLAGCSTIATATPASGTTFTATLVSGATTNGSCTLTLSDGVGQQIVIPLGYELFGYTGSDQNFSVPSGVTQITVAAEGAQGGSHTSAGGEGGSVTAQIPVSAGGLTLVVGQAGSFIGVATYGGGGATGVFPIGGSSGGGYSGVFQSGTTLLVAGGGGGAGAGVPGLTGGAGGQVGGLGSGSVGLSGGGGGGQANAGGAGGAAGGPGGGCTTLCGAGASGSSLAGGNGGSASGTNAGAGGGGGYFGGGGGGAGAVSAGGGGGSSFVTSPIGTPSYGTGTQSGNGQILITW